MSIPYLVQKVMFMKPILTVESLRIEAKAFCEMMSKQNHTALIGVTDGKAVGTYVEHLFQEYLKAIYTLSVGNSAKGIDLPGVNTDIKVTSIKQPQSSCPFKSARQKIYGLGYHLLVFVYDKTDEIDRCTLRFINCTFISAERTADYTTTLRLREMLKDGANREDLIGYLQDRGLPGDEITYRQLADELLAHTPEQGYLTISNALQWRLQYARVIGLENSVNGVTNYDW